jgi:opacity protein-like surface antigen
MHLRHTLLAAISALALSSAAQAQDYLVGYVGSFDMIDGDDEALQFGAEYRLTPYNYGLRPTIGVNVTTDGSVYGYGGLNWDIPLIEKQLYLIPNFMIGGYSQGDGKDLGHGLEFRSGIELAYQFPSEDRLGIAFNHISNASLGDKNPGAETLLINYAMPTGTLVRW